MPSPFPGMDPYLESPDIWPDFHDRLATEISNTLNQFVTLMEILGPSNKRPGPDQQAYQRKQAEVLSSAVGLIELDLLREGDRIRPRRELALWLEQLDPPADYVVWLSRRWERDRFQAFPIGLRDPLPRIPVTLGEDEAEPVLDRQAVFTRAHEGGPYRRARWNTRDLPRLH